MVVAQKRAENVQKVPLSITSLSGAELDEKSRTTIETALSNVPAVQIQAGAQGSQVYIRGVGTNGDPNAIDTDISVFLDNVYTGRNEQLGAGLYDINHVEVLRGPQGTLYGRNALGGALNVISNSPVQEAQASLNGQIGNYGLRRVDGAVNLPIGPTLAVRVAGVREDRSGYFTNGGGGTDVAAIRGKLLWKPDDRLSVLADIDYAHIFGFGQTTVSVSNVEASRPFQAEEGFEDEPNYKFLTASLQVSYDFDWAVMTAINAYSWSDREILTDLIGGNRSSADYREKQYTGELRLASPAASKVQWVAGAFVLRSNNDNVSNPSAGNFGSTGYTAYNDNPPTRSVAAFGQLTYPVTDKLRLTAGLRYTNDRKGYRYGIRSNFPVPVGGTSIFDSGLLDTPGEKADNVTYRAGVEYDVAPRSMLYANVATGFKSGGFNTTQLPPVTYEPEHLTAFEVGSKNRFLDNRLQVNVGGYYYRYRNYQLQYPLFGPGQDVNTLYTLLVQRFGTGVALAYANQYNLCANPMAPTAQCSAANPPSQFTQPVTNAETGTNYGAEAEVRFRFTPHDELDLSAAYIHARYGEVPVIPSISGTQIASAPTWSSTVAYEHNFDIAGGVLTLRGESKLSSGYVTTTSLQFPGARQGGYSRSDAYLTYSFAGNRYRVGAFVHNIENDAQITAAFPNNRLLVTVPRNWGLTFGANF